MIAVIAATSPHAPRVLRICSSAALAVIGCAGLWLGFLLGRLGRSRQLRRAFEGGLAAGAWLAREDAHRSNTQHTIKQGGYLSPEHIEAQRNAAREGWQ